MSGLEGDDALSGGTAMTRQSTKDSAASVRQRLLNKARESGRPFNEILQYYAMERFLYRLSKSPYATIFVLPMTSNRWIELWKPSFYCVNREGQHKRAAGGPGFKVSLCQEIRDDFSPHALTVAGDLSDASTGDFSRQ